MKMPHLIFGLVLLFTASLFAQDPKFSKDYVTNYGEVLGCNPICKYYPRSMEPATLIADITTLFSDLLLDQKSRLNVCSDSSICFLPFTEDVQPIIVAALVDLDNPGFKDRVFLRFELYSMLSATESNISLQTQSLGDSVSGSESAVDFAINNFVPALNVNALDKAVNFILGVGLSKGHVNSIYHMNFEVENFKNLNQQSWTTKIFVAPTQTEVKELEAGLRFNGSLRVLQDFDAKAIILTNFGLQYGYALDPNTKEANNQLITVLDTGAANYEIAHGEKKVILAADAIKTINNQAVGLLDYEGKKMQSHERIVGMITPYIVTRKEIEEKLWEKIKPDSFSDEEIAELPVDSLSLASVLSKIKLTSSFEQLGQRFIHLKLDRALARKKHLDEVFTYKIKLKDKKGLFKDKIEFEKTGRLKYLFTKGLHFDGFQDVKTSKLLAKYEKLMKQNQLELELEVKGLTNKLESKKSCIYIPSPAASSEDMVVSCK